MVKTYPRYREEQRFGVVVSSASNVAAVPGASSLVLCGALEDAVVWNVKTGQQVKRLSGESTSTSSATSPGGVAVSCLVTQKTASGSAAGASSAREVVAAGYADGSIRLWNLRTGVEVVRLHGHRKRVGCLAFSNHDSDGSGSGRGSGGGGGGGAMLLASGGEDTDVIVWDVVLQSGRFKLRGHKDAVTDCAFVCGGRKLLTASKDTLIKLWDLDTQHAVATCVGHRSEVGR
jgi:U3 small nucleolar RNA-associated protein 12